MPIPKYTWNPASRIPSKFKPEAVRVEFDRISGGNPERLTAQALLTDSQNPDRYLYDYFEWDNEKAGNEWRKRQAGEILRALVVCVVNEEAPDEPPIAVRAYIALEQDTDEQGEKQPCAFVSTLDCIADPALKARVLSRGYKEIREITNKWRRFEEFAGIMAAVDELANEFDPHE